MIPDDIQPEYLKDEHIQGNPMEDLFRHEDEKGNPVPLEDFQEKDYYSEVLEPKLKELIILAQEHRVPMMVIGTYGRTTTPEDIQEELVLITTNPADLRVGYVQRGLFVMEQDLGLWAIQPTFAQVINEKLEDMLGDITHDSQNP